MKKQTERIARKLCVWGGICLLAVAAVVMIAWQWGIQTSQKQAASYVETIRTRIPQPQGAVVEERRDNAMSVLSIQGINFIGILEMPQYGSSVPVCGDWGKVFRYPCRLSGSVYDRTIQVGATTQAGQYDFYREISVGDTVCFTDMEGNRFTYGVTDIHYETHADQAALQQEDADLTLFIQNVYALEYIVVFCNAAS